MRDEETAALSWVALMTVVGSEVPFQFNVAPGRKPVPVAVSVKPALPAIALAGERLVSVMLWVTATGSVGGEGCPWEATPTCAVPGAATSVAGTLAVSWVGDT